MTPDILISDSSSLELVIECKATRMSFEARFSDDWQEATDRGYRELAKGVGQIWRYCSHLRRGLVTEKSSQNLTGLVLTMDPWLRMTHQQDKVIFDLARDWCASSNAGVTADDECPIAFTHIEDFERLLHRTDKDGALKVLRKAARNIGWGVAELGQEEDVAKDIKPYVFRDRMAEVLPWYRIGPGSH